MLSGSRSQSFGEAADIPRGLAQPIERAIVYLNCRREAAARYFPQEPIKGTLPMSNYDGNAGAPGFSANDATAIDVGLRAFMLRVYNYMAAGVGLTGVAAFLTYQFTGPELLQSPLMWVFMLAPLGLVFFISARINTMSVEAARGLFFLYATLVGISLSTIFHIYTASSITRVFFISAAAFGALSIWGYTTQRNLSGFHCRPSSTSTRRPRSRGCSLSRRRPSARSASGVTLPSETCRDSEPSCSWA
jgi:hypothetical protein